MQRYFLELAYNGANYAGWQSQLNAIGVQSVLEAKMAMVFRQHTPVLGSGRTDAGVHAMQQFAHFDALLPDNSPQALDKWTYKLNALLPPDISIAALHKVAQNAHARFDATSRSYIYRITRKKSSLSIGAAYQMGLDLDIVAMQTACQHLLLHTHFQCFSKVHTDVFTYNCTITEARWEAITVNGVPELHFFVTANRFLRGMVRAIVGTLLLVGQGRLSQEGFLAVLASNNRSAAGSSVPAHGLYLSRVVYPYL